MGLHTNLFFCAQGSYVLIQTAYELVIDMAFPHYQATSRTDAEAETPIGLMLKLKHQYFGHLI